MIFIGIIIPIIVFCFIINGTYAYFTATARSEIESALTGTLMLKLSADTTAKINSTAITASQKILPGDTLSFSGTLENAGTHPFYAVFEFVVKVKKESAEDFETILSTYYTFVDSTETKITITDNGGNNSYSANAFLLSSYNASSPNAHKKSFNLSFNFDGETYDEEYENASINYSFKAFAIQSAAIGGAADATDILIKTAQEEHNLAN